MDIRSAIEQAATRAGTGYERVRDTEAFRQSVKHWSESEQPARVLNRMSSLGLHREVVDLAAAVVAGDSASGLNPLERIIAASQLMSSVFLSVGAARMRAVGRIVTETGRGFGTGFLISPRLLMTNNHVIDTPSLAARCRVQFDFVRAVDGTIGVTELYRLLPNEFFLTAVPKDGLNLDYTIVAIEAVNSEGKSAARRGSIPLISTSGKLVLGDLTNIIQHPGGEPQQIALRDSKVVKPLDHFIRYEADTQPGSSGSPVFNDLWQVGALHHSGVADEVRPGVYRLVNGGEWDTRQPLSHEDELRMAAQVKWIANEGVRISSIVNDVQQRLRNDAVKLALFEEAVREQDTTAIEMLRTVSAPSQPAVELSGGNSVTWTVPLRVTVQLGPELQLSLSGDARPVVAVPQVPAAQPSPMPTSSPTSSDAEEAAARLGVSTLGVKEILEVRPGFLWENGVMTDTEAVVVVLDPKAVIAGDPHETLKLPREIKGVPVDITVGGATALFRALERSGGLAAESESLADLLQESVPEIGYKPPANVKLEEVEAPMEVLCHVSPDDGWPMLKDFLDRTKNTITLGMFDLTAPHIVDKFKELGKRPEFRMNLAIQQGMAGGLKSNKKEDIPEDKFIADIRKLMGKRFRQAFVDVSGPDRTFASAYHIKVAVRDHEEFWLSSGNMQSSNQPDRSPAADNETTFAALNGFNREWHVIIKNKGLATTFEKFLLHDLETAEKNPAEPPKPQNEALVPFVPEDFTFLEAGKEAQYFDHKTFPRKSDAPVRVRPLLTPDNFLSNIIPLVKTAKKRLFIQNQSLTILQPRDKNEKDFLDLFEAILDRQKKGVDVRLIFRVMPVDEDAARGVKDALVKFGFKKDTVFVQERCHTKGIIIDSEVVVMGSHNWTNQGTIVNRDASLIIHHPDIARYYEEIFLFDWETLKREPKPAKPKKPGDESVGPAVATERVTPEELVLGD